MQKKFLFLLLGLTVFFTNTTMAAKVDYYLVNNLKEKITITFAFVEMCPGGIRERPAPPIDLAPAGSPDDTKEGTIVFPDECGYAGLGGKHGVRGGHRVEFGSNVCLSLAQNGQQAVLVFDPLSTQKIRCAPGGK